MNNALDCRGLACPQPVIRCRDLINETDPASFSVLVDNTAALENVQRFLIRNGYSAEVRQTSENGWEITASKAGNIPMIEEHEVACQSPNENMILVFLTTETLGLGDDELGARLMTTFLANLSELGNNLWRIILLNGAVKLSAREGETLNALQTLEKAGVSILVCGTCLNHYGLLEKKKVGETTNMMDVITSLALAQKIIRP